MKTVVVVGGGVAGAEVVRGLSSRLNPEKHRLILITSRPRFTFLPASLRLLASQDTAIGSVFMPYDAVFGKFPGELKVGTVTSIEENKDPTFKRGGFVVMEGDEKILYDVLVVATGSNWYGHLAFPNDEEGFKDHVKSWQKKIHDAKHIVIAGGGAVGIEMSGEIKDAYPNKHVTIVHANRLLLGDIYPDKFRENIESRIRLRGVNILFNDTIEGTPNPHAPLKTGNGVPLPCDLLLFARGGRPNTSLLKFLRPNVLSDRGYVRVKPTLQIDQHPNMFALGDIIDWPEAKQLMKISMGHTAVVIANVISYLEGKVPKKTYNKSPELLWISNGRAGGASYLGLRGHGLTFGNCFTKLVKSNDLMVAYVRKSLGLGPNYEKD
ncbi:Apoptosis-inducing factor-like protein A [Psilocybe cubensis]|uniref:Apoptosis-inducing factor-like protein A n=2 Tax=Psilocybe cubensis TaxID=181762 RepID=A0ACB8GQ95_PSICU|nr:Apoptosis-inducing factor-like protein A [Psilocybe cubensis]KAH9477744.1 Apoptosis-inducing factor-like protein A [Psilocybe cubensis]